jgi:hypothetical protein
MDLLSMVGLATRQRDTYFQHAERLAKQFPDLEQLEKRMEAEGRVIVKGLRDREMKFEEYERALIDKTLTSALAAVYLGAGESQPKQKMERAWPEVVSQLTPLNVFLKETKDYIDDGVLRYGDDSLDFSDESVWADEVDLEPEWEGIPGTEQAAIETTQRRAQGRTWPSLLGRVLRYVANPAYSFFELGVFMDSQQKGYRLMRRLAVEDKRTCPDCRNYDDMGWQPIGELPMPGRGCRCYDRCRCRIEYR